VGLSSFDLQGKVALVTGGATGIGLGIAHGLAQAGAAIVICGRRSDRLKSACAELALHGVPTLGLACDVSQPGQVTAMVNQTVHQFGHIDILVNNAGVTGAARSLLDLELADWQRTLDINLTGVMLCSQAAARQMARQGGGKIINVASVGAFKPLPHSGDYCASKGGVLMLTRTIALELIKHNINVNAICPGYFATDLNRAQLAMIEAQASKRIPAGRVGDVRQLQGAAVLLASPASDYMVGSAIVVDGGVMLR
jgi:NAD(P)-dependent dehydrogenase (short-subunit alcohol dehydrogenase family)